MEPPNLTITNPAGVCMPQKIDITDPAITAGSESGLLLTYWKNSTTTIPLPNPNAIDISGTYYIMGIKNGGCGAVKPVDVKIGEVPNIVIHNPTGCGKVDLTDASVTSGSTSGISAILIGWMREPLRFWTQRTLKEKGVHIILWHHQVQVVQSFARYWLQLIQFLIL